MHLCLGLAPRPPHPPPSTTETKSKSKSTNGNNYCRIIRYHHHDNALEEYLRQKMRIDPQRALSLNPELRGHPLRSLQHSHSLLLSTGLSPAQVSRVFASQPLLLTHPFDHSLRFLEDLFPHDVPETISRCPRLLSCPVPSQLSPALLFLRRLSIPITPATSLLLGSHLDTTLLPKLDFLHSLGLPFRDVKSVLRRFPRLFTYSVPNNLHPKAHFLQHHMRLHVPTEIRRFPQYFASNLETKIKRRHRLLLQNCFRMSLREMLTTSDGDFDQRILDRKLQMLDRIILTRHHTTTS